MLRMIRILVAVATIAGLAACSASGGSGPFDHPAGLGVQGPDGALDADVEEGRKHLERGDHDAALTALLKARKRHPDAPALQYLLAEVHQATGQCLKAATHLARVGTVGSLGRSAQTLASRWIRDLAEGTSACTPRRKTAAAAAQLLALNPDIDGEDLRERLAALFLNRAQALESSGRCKNATLLVDHATSLGGPHREGMLLRGRCLLRRGLHDEVLVLAKGCLDRTPPAEDLVAALARVAEETFRHDSAIALWALLQTRDGHVDEATSASGRLLLKARRADEAAASWRAYVAHGEDPAERLERAVEAAIQLGEFERVEDAIALLDAGLAERPDDFPAVRLRASLLWRSERRSDAVAALKIWMDGSGDLVDSFETVLELLTDWEGWSEGLKLLYQVRVEAGGRAPAEIAPLAALYTGLYRTRLNDLDQARQAFATFQKIEGHRGRARARIGAALFAIGDPSRALPWLEAAVKRKPRYTDASPDLASVYHALDRGDRIPKLFEKYISAATDKGAAWAEVAHWWAGVGRFKEALAASANALPLFKLSPPPTLILLHGRLLLTEGESPDQAWPLLEEAAMQIDAGALVEVWRLAAQRPGRQAGCVRAAVLRRPEARIHVNSDGQRALILPSSGGEGVFPLSLDAELNDLLGCDRGDVGARIDGYLAETQTRLAAVEMASALVRVLLYTSYPDRVAKLLERYPEIPLIQPTEVEFLLIKVLLTRAPVAAVSRLRRLASSPGIDPSLRLSGAEIFLSVDAPEAAEIILGDNRADFDDQALCHALRLLVEARLHRDASAEAMAHALTMSDRCGSRPGEIVTVLEMIADRGPAAEAFELAIQLLGRFQEPTQVRRIVVAAVRAGHRADLALREVGDRLARASKGWKGEVEVAGVLAATGRFAAAAQLLDAARKRNPQEGETLKRILLLHRMASLAGRGTTLSREDVVGICEQHLLANERSDVSLITLLGFLEGLGYSKIAAELADRHLPADTSNAGLLLLRASLAIGAGASEQAPTLLDKGMMAAPNIADFLDAATGLLERYGRHGDAIRLLETSLQVRPDLPELALQLALRLSNTPSPDWTKVAGLIDGAIARSSAHLEMGVRILLGGNRYDLALPIIAKVRDGANEQAVWTATRIMVGHAAEMGAHAEVRDAVAAFTARKLPGFRIQTVADLLFEHGYLDEGLALLERHQGKDPNQAAGVLLALKLIQAGRVDEGRRLVDLFFEDLVLGHRKITRSDRMTDELHKLFDNVNDFLWDMGLPDHAATQLDRAIETYPDDPHLLERRCRSILADPEGKAEDALALFQQLLEVEADPASTETRNLAHLLASRGLGSEATNIALDAHDPARPAWWTPMLLELLVVQDQQRALRRVVELLAARSGGTPALLASCGAALLGRGETDMAESLLRQALLRTRHREAGISGGPKSALFSQVGEASTAIPNMRFTGRIMVLLIKAMVAGGASETAVHKAARGALRIQGDDEGVSPDGRVLLASALDDAELWDAAIAEWGLQQALGEGGSTPYLREFRVHLMRGHEEAARSALWRCIATTPGTTGLLTRFADQARRVLALDLSVELFRLARQLDGTNQALAFAAAEPLLLLGREAEAKVLLELYAGDGGPDSIRNQRLEAAALAYRYNRFALASSLAAEDDSSAAWLERSRHHIRAGDSEEGWRLFEEAAKRAKEPALAARALLATMIQIPATSTGTTTTPNRRLVENLLARAQNPKSSPTVNRYWEGVLLLQRDRKGEAVRSFEAGLRGTRARFGLGISMVKQLLASGRVEEAEAFAGRTFAGFKKAAVRTELAKAVAEALHAGLVPEKFVPAVADLGVRVAKAALVVDPADTWVLTQLAEVQYAAGLVDDAVSTYDKAIGDLPGDSGMENNQAYLLALTGREIERGLALVKAAIRREPSHNIFYLDTLGWLQYGQGRLEEAEANIHAALVRADFSTPGGLAEALYHLGIVQRDLGRLEDAKAAFHRSSVNDPYGNYGARARTELQKLGVDPFHR